MPRVRANSGPTRGGWRRWSAEEAREALDAWQASGKSLGEYERAHGISAERLRRWGHRLGRSTLAAQDSEVRLVPAVVRPSATFAPIAVRMPGGVVLELADVSAAPSDWIVSVAAGLAEALR